MEYITKNELYEEMEQEGIYAEDEECLEKDEMIKDLQVQLENKNRPENENIYEIFLEIGRKRGCMISGGNIDEEKTARIILDEFKNGKIGKITLE